MSNIERRVTKLEGQIKPIEAEPTPLTDEERAEEIRALLVRAEADPADYTLQQRAASIIQTFIIAKGRAEGVNTFDIEMKAIAKWRAYFERIKRGGQTEGIYAKMWTEAIEEIRQAADNKQQAGMVESQALSPIVEDLGADALSVDVSQPENVFENVSQGDDAGAIEPLPASPEPSPPPETPALPPERKPRPLIRSGGLRPAGGRASGPWRR